MLLAEATSRFLPPLSPLTLLGIVGAALVVLLAARWLLGPANEVARRGSLWALRGIILALVALVLFNPVRVTETPGPHQRPEIFYLLDTSASMQMGAPRSRWDESLALLKGAQQLVPETSAEVKAFRFGQRLAAVDPAAQLGLTKLLAGDGLTITPASLQTGEKGKDVKPILPTDGDTRLLAALRQISSRFGRVPPQGVVIVSDGRAHDEVGLEQLAAQFAKLKVPLHVAPIGDLSKGGDIAVSAVVAPPRARKFTEVDVQVFVRSFGYDGKRSEVQLLELLEDGQVGRKLCPPLPITLQSGFQSVSLSFRTELNTRKLRVAIPALADEVTAANNQIDAEMQIERTKIRVLYVEGSNQPLTQVRVGDRYQIRGAFSDLKAALTEDEDIECVVLAAQPGGLVRVAEYAAADGVRGFPTTVAELSAFDAMILSNVAAEAFTEKQLDWIDQWIGQRGGGLCMLGGENSFASGGWRESKLAPLLPVEMAPGGFDWIGGEPVKIAAALPPSPHALWTIVADEQQNRQIVATFPQVLGVNRWLGARPNLTSVLATTSVSGTPAAPVPANQPLSLQSLGNILQGAFQPKPQAIPQAAPPAGPASDLPVVVAGRYSRGRTLAVAIPLTSPNADEVVQKWGSLDKGSTDNRYYAKFCRNLVNWLTESSMIGRRRLVATTDKRFYRPGETISIQAATYDESAAPTKNYTVKAMVEPHTAPGEPEPEESPLKWPSGLTRPSKETGPLVVWGEEFDLALGGQDRPLHQIQLPLADVLASGASSQSLRVELTAYEDRTQVDSTSLDIQILHDPFEQQNPFPNHELLAKLAAASGGKVIRTPADLAAILRAVPLDVGEPIVRHTPLWSTWWLWGLIIGLLSVEWIWRRSLGLA